MTSTSLSTAAAAAHEARLVEGFLAAQPMQELAFVAALRPLLRAQVRKRWPGQWRHLADLEQSAIERALRFRRDEPARVKPPLEALAEMLLVAPARAERKLPLHAGLESLGVAQAPTRPASQEEAFELNRVRALAADLPRGQSTMLLCHVAHLTGDGPPPHEALGLREDVARKRLVRAQAALFRKAYGQEARGSESDDAADASDAEGDHGE